MSSRLAVLASGRGSNLQALIDAIAAGRIGARLVGVISDKPEALALQRAAQVGIPAQPCSPRQFATRVEHDAALADALAALQPDLVVCAGYMRILGDAVLAPFAGRMINIHPSLLPKYPGLRTHQQVLDAGDGDHGASVHMVIPELDAGAVIAQTRIAVLPGDNAESLARRLLPLEHRLLVATVAAIAAGVIELAGTQVRFKGRTLASPLLLAADGQLKES